MAGTFGYPSQQAFEDALAAEVDALNGHSHGPSGERPGQHPSRPAKQKFLRGKPGSQERLEWIASLGGGQNRGLVQQTGRSLEGEKILAAVKRVQREPSPEAIAEAAQLVIGYEDVAVAREAIKALEPTGYADEFVAELGTSARQWQEANLAADEQTEQRRLEERQRLLHREYQRVQGDPMVEAAVDGLAQQIGDDLYAPDLHDAEAQMMLRTQAEMARREQHALKSFGTLAAIGDEIIRRHGPGGVTDEQRANWEREVRAGELEVFDRYNPTPEQAMRAAARSVAEEEVFKDGTPFEAELNAEFARMEQHSSDAPHRQAMRDETVKDFEQHFDETGRRKL